MKGTEVAVGNTGRGSWPNTNAPLIERHRTSAVCFIILKSLPATEPIKQIICKVHVCITAVESLLLPSTQSKTSS